jgi:hypothetical protein
MAPSRDGSLAAKYLAQAYKTRVANFDLTAEALKLENLGMNIKVLFGDFLEKRAFRSEINFKKTLLFKAIRRTNQQLTKQYFM